MAGWLGPDTSPPPPDKIVSAALNFSLTKLLIATWFNLLVYTFELNLGLYFLKISSRKSSRAVVMIGLALETAATLLVCIHGYNHFFLYDSAMDAALSWNLPVITIFTNLSMGAEQLYFTHRFWTLSHNRVVAGGIAAAIVIRLILVIPMVIYTRIVLYRNGSLVRPFSITIAACAVVTDFTIAVMSVRTMKKIKTAYDSTQNLLKRMIVYAVTCGIFTALCTIITSAIAFAGLDTFNIIFFALGRIYTLTILLNFMIIRGSGRDVGSDLPESTPQVLQPNSIDLLNLPTPRASMIMSTNHVSTCDDYLDEAGRYKRPPPAPSFSMDNL